MFTLELGNIAWPLTLHIKNVNMRVKDYINFNVIFAKMFVDYYGTDFLKAT